mgnify:FL=1
MNHKLKAILTVLSTAMLIGCGKAPVDDCAPVEIHRFDRAAYRYATADSADRQAIRDTFAVALRIMLGNDISDSSLTAYSQSRGVRVFTPDIESRFLSLDSIEAVTGCIYSRMGDEFPDITPPEIYSAAITYNQSIILADTVILLGLNHYLGCDYEGYNYLDSYRRATKTATRQPYDIAESIIATAYPFRPSNDATVLSRLLYEGALVKAVMLLVPDSDTATALGYDKSQLTWLAENEAPAWNALIERKMLYSTDMDVASRLTAAAPHTTLLHPQSPGRAGRYIGLRIIESYMKRHPEATLRQMLDSTFYNSASPLIRSGYNPSRR